MSELLDSLYKEYSSLAQKLEKIADLIQAYGGQVPSQSRQTVLSAALSLPPTTFYGGGEGIPIEYPVGDTGTWKDKIKFTLDVLNAKVTAREISDFIVRKEDMETEKVEKSVSQYLWSMSKDNEILIDKTGGRARYSLKR